MALKIICLIFLLAQATTAVLPAPPMPLLRGRIEHSDRLTPVDASLRPGVKCDVLKLRQLEPDNFWYQIPDWAAGSFHREKETTYYTYWYGTRQRNYDTDSFTSRGNETRGWQQDRLGKVWEFAYRDYVTVTEHDTTWRVHLVKDCELVEADQDHMVLRFLADSLTVSKETRTIIDTDQSESLQTYVACGNTLVKCDGSIKTFDDDGNPVCLAKNLVFELRTKEYKPNNQFRSRNMQALFAEFLHTHGHDDLIPSPNHYIPLHQAIGSMKQPETASANYLSGRTSTNDTTSHYNYHVRETSTYGYCCVTPAISIYSPVPVPAATIEASVSLYGGNP